MFSNQQKHLLVCLLITLSWLVVVVCMGAVVPPVLFSALPSNIAGTLVGRFFVFESWLSLSLGVTLLGWFYYLRSSISLRRLMLLTIAAMLCVVCGELILLPAISDLREGMAKLLVQDAGLAALRKQFALFHGLSMVFYWLKAIFIVLIMWRIWQHLRRPPIDQAAFRHF